MTTEQFALTETDDQAIAVARALSDPKSVE